ncbi:MAG: hypothetical protein ACP5G1_01345 [Nanopusillaceae archaeon]
MYEDINYMSEGIIYCRVKKVTKDKIYFDINGKEYSFDKTVEMNELREGDYVRFYIKKDKIIFIEKIDENFYKEIKSILDKLKE